MHAYLIVGNSEKLIANRIEQLARKLKVKTLEFPLEKIADVRALNAFASLTLSEPTAIVLKNIDHATTEALNAFLKNLEEPQENLYFILTARSTLNLLPTIVSRCQVVKTGYQKQRIESRGAEDFIKMDVGERLVFTEAVRKRDEALNFVENFILACHEKLARGINISKLSSYLKAADFTRTALKQNGNVTVQLTNLVVQLEAFSRYN